MKKIFDFILLLTISVGCFCQQTFPGAPSQPDYLKRARRQQTIATIMLVSAPVLIIVPLAVVSGLKTGGEATAGIVYGSIIGGFFCIPASIGLFIVSSVNHKKGVKLGLKNESMTRLRNNGFAKIPVPSLSLKISL